MFKKKISIMAMMAILSASLIGCSSSDDSQREASAAEVLANQNARIAIAQVIDKEAMCDVVIANGSFATNIWTSQGLAVDENGNDYTELLKDAGYEYNEEAAKEAWAKAKEEVGFDTVNLEMVTFDHDLGKRIGEFVQGELSDLEGLSVSIVALPVDQKLARTKASEFDIAYAGLGPDYPDPLTFLTTMETDKGYAAHVGYSNETYDKLLEEARKITTASERFEKYAQAERMMLEDCFILPIFQKGYSYLEREYVSGIIANSYGADYTYTYADVDKEDKTLNLSMTSDIATMDISKVKDNNSFEGVNAAMEGLTRLDENNNATPGVATSWEVSEDGLTWTFKLRDNSYWSNGEKVTAHDFEYSWKRTLTPETAAEYAMSLYDIEGAEDYHVNGGSIDNVGVKAIDDTTLEVKLNRPVSYFPQLVAFMTFFPQNQAFVEECGESYGTDLQYQLYNGPFVLSSWKKEDQFSLTKNEKYWDAQNVKLQTINYKVVKDTGAAVALYESNEIDRVSLSSDSIDKYKNDANFKVQPTQYTYILEINAGKNE
jgi:oligopeptide transport system substrate-binding protein